MSDTPRIGKEFNLVTEVVGSGKEKPGPLTQQEPTRIQTFIAAIQDVPAHPDMERFVGTAEKIIVANFPTPEAQFGMAGMISDRWLGSSTGGS